MSPSFRGCCDRRFSPDKLIRVVVRSRQGRARILQLRASTAIRDEFARDAATARQVGIAGDRFEAVPIPVPPLEEQRRIVSESSSGCSGSIAASARSTRAARLRAALRRAILERAFRGELVQQDPDDEPASVLLERIRAERARRARRSARREGEASVSDAATAIVQKLWNYCNVLRDDGLSYGDYVEQLTYLLFLKMADEQTQPPCNRPAGRPRGLRLAVAARSATATSSRRTTGTSSTSSASSRGCSG